jgi:mono/diheme cytochrome c family protein
MRAAAALMLWSLALPVHAADAQQMVLGRMVVARANAPSLVAGRDARGQYVLHCAGCHRVDGAGVPEKYVPDLRQLGAFLRVEGGREFVIQVPGVMGSGLDDRQVAEVANWLLATLARDSVVGNPPPYTAAEVTTARARPIADVAATRARLVLQAQARGIALN